ncbi:MAG: beta-propeller domain-containing protein [Clostridia bacterium]|nr:beta-propeller domain-containing protein [Clostridia bacterium]
MKTYEELTQDILEKTKVEKTRRRRLATRITAGAAAFVLFASAVAVPTILRQRGASPVVAPYVNTPVTAQNDYSEVYKKLQEISSKTDLSYAGYAKGGLTADGAMPETAVQENTEDAYDLYKADDAVDGEPYSDTNVQVAGVMEADVFKTDGQYLYAVSHRNIYIYKANAGQFTLLSTIPYRTEDNDLISNSDGAERMLSIWETPEMYVTDNRLILIAQANEKSKAGSGSYNDDYYYDGLMWNTRAYTAVMIFDITDRTAPVLLHTAAISGSRISSRMIDDVLYVAACDSYYVNEDVRQDDPEAYIPKLFCDGEVSVVAPDTIYCGEEAESSVFLNVCKIDTATGDVSSSLSLLGYNGDMLYQSENNLYVAAYADISDHQTDTSPNAAGVSIVTETYFGSYRTAIAKIALTGELRLVGSVTLAGRLNNSFSMDEYNGYLRVVLSTDTWHSVSRYAERSSWNITENEWDYEVDDLDYDADDLESDWQEDRANALYILGDTLDLVGSLSGIAPDERVYSARFEGDHAYFVTYRETDPLFHVDLSDPTNPVIVSELKIPGFSTYLHRYGEWLFGFGETDDGGLKLSMFAENDAGEMSEIATLPIDGAYYSEALYNHHAILIDPEKNLIGFSAYSYSNGEYTMTYYIVSFDQATGFTVKATIPIGEADTVRALYIGNVLYLYQNSYAESGLTSFFLDTFQSGASVTMDVTEIPEPEDIDYEDYEPIVYLN